MVISPKYSQFDGNYNLFIIKAFSEQQKFLKRKWIYVLWLWTKFRLFSELCTHESESDNYTVSPNHCVKGVQIRSYFWFVFSYIWPEYRKIEITLYLVTFLHSDIHLTHFDTRSVIITAAINKYQVLALLLQIRM